VTDSERREAAERESEARARPPRLDIDLGFRLTEIPRAASDEPQQHDSETPEEEGGKERPPTEKARSYFTEIRRRTNADRSIPRDQNEENQNRPTDARLEDVRRRAKSRKKGDGGFSRVSQSSRPGQSIARPEFVSRGNQDLAGLPLVGGAF
jgi:hypothetical protein